VDFLACWRHTKKATVMGAVVSLKGYRANARPGILAGPISRSTRPIAAASSATNTGSYSPSEILLTVDSLPPERSC
jgi:hypothetical protein